MIFEFTLSLIYYIIKIMFYYNNINNKLKNINNDNNKIQKVHHL